jgi:hypothetical protein
VSTAAKRAAFAAGRAARAQQQIEEARQLLLGATADLDDALVELQTVLGTAVDGEELLTLKRLRTLGTQTRLQGDAVQVVAHQAAGVTVRVTREARSIR